MSDQQKFKQFGNSVSISHIEEMALFIKKCVNRMENEFSEQEKERYKKSGVTIKMKAKIQDALKDASSETLEKYDWLISEFRVVKEFCAKDIKTVLEQSEVTTYKYPHRLECAKCVELDGDKYKMRIEKNSLQKHKRREADHEC